ncbi:MAG: PIN domain-containing protein [Gammaproteobacteria bacterium]|nr:PIN domain-containing protein [Gammaproteobacteria bacterium]
MLSLLDVNVLIALLDENHAHHAVVVSWFRDNVEDGWASSPITQNGALRILSQPKYPNMVEVGDARLRLREATSTSHHRFLADDISLLDDDILDAEHLLGHRQLTDVYLLALATAHDSRLVTLDTAVPLGPVRGATEDSLLIL